MKERLIILFELILIMSEEKSEDTFVRDPKETIIEDIFVGEYSLPQRDYGWVDALREYALQGLSSSGRVRVVDGNDILELRAVDYNNYGTAEGMRERYEIAINNGVDSVLEGVLNQAYADIDRRAEKPRWSGFCGYTIRLVEPRTVNSLTTFKYSPSDGKSTSDQPDKAISETIRRVVSRMNCYVLDNFRIEGQITDIIEVKKDEVKEVALNVGKPHGAYKGTKFEVYEILTVGNKVVPSKIGEGKINDVKSDDVSFAKVTHGGKKIREALSRNETRKVLSCKSG